MTIRTLPPVGLKRDEVLRALEKLRVDDVRWSEGVMQGFIYHPDDDVVEVALEAMGQFYDTNALLAHRGFPSLSRIRDDVIAIGSELLNAPARAGLVTTGGSESNMLALWIALRQAREARAVVQPNVVLPYSAHPCLDKAAIYFGVEVRRVPLAEDFRADVSAMVAAIDENTVLLVGSAPDYPHGVVDPIPELGQVALDAGVPLHVDACLGGFILPFVEGLGRHVPPWDFRVPGVTSISADIHKHAYGPKGISLLLTDTTDRAALARFEFWNWPQGHYATENVGGTRSGAALAGAWATFMTLGQAGYERLTQDVMAIAERFQHGIEALEGLFVLGSPVSNKFAYSSNELDIFAVADALEQMGWVVTRQGDPEAIGMHAALFHRDSVGRYIESLEAAVREVRAGRIIRSGEVAAYN